jgi:hypothetical protein
MNQPLWNREEIPDEYYDNDLHLEEDYDEWDEEEAEEDWEEDEPLEDGDFDRGYVPFL